MNDVFTEDELARIEQDNPEGLTSERIVDLFIRKNLRFTEASLRKYVQLGLLPRSRRVAIKDKSRGSQGVYPATVIRRIQRLKAMMVNHTIEEIKAEFLFVRGDIEELENAMERVFMALSSAAKPHKNSETVSKSVVRELIEARSLAADLMAKLSSVEARLTMQAKLHREAV
ncbi:hypothetical protein BH09MYX1_BH09MYX1_59030 [soil metagenome]